MSMVACFGSCSYLYFLYSKSISFFMDFEMEIIEISAAMIRASNMIPRIPRNMKAISVPPPE